MTGNQRKRLIQALTSAFTDEKELARMVNFALNKNINAFVDPGDLTDRAFDLVIKCEARGWLTPLLAGARDENPGNEELELIVLELGSDLGFDPKLPDTGELQKVVVDHSKFQDPEKWLINMAACLKKICRVEASKGVAEGTGFLVGPSLVITNYHVAENLNENEALCRFDYRILPDGKALRPGTEYKLKRKDWLKASSPTGQLDYALIELDGTPGEDSPGKGKNAAPRGWLAPLDYQFEKGEPMVIVQHPSGRHLEMAFGAVLAPASATRVTHSVSTEPGSSGSPCFDSSLELVALHYYGSDTKNAAIPFSLILAHMGEARKLLVG